MSAGRDFEFQTRARSPWASIKILDTERMPWGLDSNKRRTKTLFENKETGSHLAVLEIGVGASGGPIRYHTFHEWSYWLSGDYILMNFLVPNQHQGVLSRKREGYFMERPPYSLHYGGEKGRQDCNYSQMGGAVLVMEEGDLAGETFSVHPGDPNYNPEYKQIKHWAMPRNIDTIGQMPWEQDPSVPGLCCKFLADDPICGFRATMWFLPAGWNSSLSMPFSHAYYYKQAYQFNFVLNGDLLIQAYEAPGESAEKINLGKHFYIERPPMSIFGLADGVVSQRGCVWLEVTYGKGTSVSDTPIEEKNYLQ